MGEEERAEDRKRAIRGSLLFKGPTVVAALVCLVAAMFSIGLGTVIVISPDALQGTFFVNLTGGSLPTSGIFSFAGEVMLGLGLLYMASAVLLWSETHWIKGVYAGIVVSMFGTVAAGLGTTLAPGIAAAGMIINVLIVTLLATETWEATRGMK